MQFTYDGQLAALLGQRAGSIPEVVATLQAIDGLLDGTKDGLAWFNSLYLQVTVAVQARVHAGAFDDARGTAFIANLDFTFANLYLSALSAWLGGRVLPQSWRVLFEQRANVDLARIQFALAGVNAHINRDLAVAIVNTCRATGVVPDHETAEYRAYTALNQTLDSLIEQAKRELMVRLPGDALPGADKVEIAIASWSVAAARETAWVNSEVLWKVRDETILTERFMDGLDGAAELVGKGLLIRTV